MGFSTKDYDVLENAISRGTRLCIWRRGTEYLVIPQALHLRGGREMIEARHPSTGQRLELFLDEIESFEAVR